MSRRNRKFNQRKKSQESGFGLKPFETKGFNHTWGYYDNFFYDSASSKDINEIALEVFGGTYYRHNSIRT